MYRNGEERIYARLPRGEGGRVRLSDLPANAWRPGSEHRRGAAHWRQKPYSDHPRPLWVSTRTIRNGEPTSRWTTPKRVPWWKALWL